MYPLIFITFGADLEEWTEFSSIFTYADDTSSSTSANNIEEVIEKLEMDD